MAQKRIQVKGDRAGAKPRKKPRDRPASTAKPNRHQPATGTLSPTGMDQDPLK
jgi:hypothetical protein